jgi:hypothetical protein
MQNYHLINVHTIPATNTKGQRISISSPRFKQRVIIGFAYNRDLTCYEQAAAWLRGLDFNIIGVSETKQGYALISDTFKPLKG